jgi:glycosyltransferase involved in cell wall biosynthesis
VNESKYPPITVITPSYNQGQFLEQTIKSVVGQGYPNLEYLILDGGSTDNSPKIIKKYAKKYPNVIKWRSEPDKGQVAAINEGLAKAKGEIVTYLNSDDFYRSRSLFSVANFFTKHSEINWLYGQCDVTSRPLKWTFLYKSLWPVYRIPQLLYLLNPLNQPAVFLTKNLIKKVGKFDNRYALAFDYDYWLRCLKFSTPGYVNKKLAVFRIHNNSKGNQGYTRQFNEEITILRRKRVNKTYYWLHFFHNILVKFAYSLLKK